MSAPSLPKKTNKSVTMDPTPPSLPGQIAATAPAGQGLDEGVTGVNDDAMGSGDGEPHADGAFDGQENKGCGEYEECRT